MGDIAVSDNANYHRLRRLAEKLTNMFTSGINEYETRITPSRPNRTKWDAQRSFISDVHAG